MPIPRRAYRLYRSNSELFVWFRRAYLLDWLVVGLLWTMSYLAEYIPVFEREYSRTDPLISYKHHKSQVNSVTNNTVAFLVPISVITVFGLVQRSSISIHHGVISVCAGRGLARLVTETLKNIVGRLRPDFLARCKWDSSLKACSGSVLVAANALQIKSTNNFVDRKIEDVLDGRRSFPSGHSSAAFASMTFLALWLAGQTGAWSFGSNSSNPHLGSSRLAGLCLSLLPFAWSTYVAITRLEDYRHHKEDVIAGSMIGIASAIVCYIIFWRSPWHAAVSASGSDIPGQPRHLYVDGELGPGAEQFELAGMGDEEDV